MRDDQEPRLELLSPDDLGDVGEHEFASLAAKGPLIVNKAVRDRGGWDFMLQASAENEADVHLDERNVLWTTYVQVKAIWNDRSPTVRLSLSAAEKLAKYKEATFVAVLLYDRLTRDCTSLYLVELAADRLAQILKALRQHQHDGVRALNDKSIYIRLRASERLKEVTGPAIRERLAQAHRRAGAKGYPVMKTRELATLGLSDRSLRGVVTLHDIDVDGLFEVLTGKRSWRASLSDFVETRFDIDLPARGVPGGVGQVRFTPKSLPECELTVSWKGVRERLVFTGHHHLVTLPGPNGLFSRSLMTFGGFNIEHEGAKVSLSAHTSGDVVLSLPAWRRFWRLMEGLRTRSSEFSLRSPHFEAPLTWEYDAGPDQIPSHAGNLLIAFEAANDLADQLDLTPAPAAMLAISRQAKSIIMARHLGTPGKPNFTFSISSVHSGEAGYDRSPQDGVYVDFFDLGDTRIAYATRLRMVCCDRENEDEWVSHKAKRLDIRRIDRTEEAFAAFAEEAKAMARSDKLFLGDIDDAFLRKSVGETTEF